MADGNLIHVTLLNAADGACFDTSDVPAEKIQDSFEAPTTLTLGGEDWDVVAADPMTRAEYEKTGSLRLTLRRVEVRSVPVNDIFFSLPTLNDRLPDMDPDAGLIGKRILYLHEDDWRQLECVTRSLQSDIDESLAAVRRVLAEERHPAGFFRKLHVRREVAAPLQGSYLALSELRRRIPLTPLDGVAFRGMAGLVAAGFAFQSPGGLRLYGVRKGEAAATLGVAADHARPEAEPEALALAALMRDHNLCLIDWCGARQMLGSDDEMTEWLRSHAT